MDLPPLSGAVFIFFSKNRQQVKLLRWDTDGFTLYQKRLEKGTFEIPYFNIGKKACVIPYKTPVRHTERNIVEINKISQETEYRWFRARKLLIISIIFDKNR